MQPLQLFSRTVHIHTIQSSRRKLRLHLHKWNKRRKHAALSKKRRTVTYTIPNMEAELPIPPRWFQGACVATVCIITSASAYCLGENLLFGTVAGITAKTCTAPLERLTTHRQASIDTTYTVQSIVRDIYHEEGILGFWRGNGINVFRASIQKGSLFALNDFFRSLTIDNMHTESHLATNESIVLSFMCGAMAGLGSTLITYPLDPVKTVNQATIHKQKWPAMTIWYSLSQNRGYLKGPWIAALPTFAGTTVYYGVKFMAFDVLTRYIDSISELCGIEIQRDI
eukprot:355670_1